MVCQANTHIHIHTHPFAEVQKYESSKISLLETRMWIEEYMENTSAREHYGCLVILQQCSNSRRSSDLKTDER